MKTKLNLSTFPSGGRFYRDDFEIQIRPAKAREALGDRSGGAGRGA